MSMTRFTLTQYLEYIKPLFIDELNALVMYQELLTTKRIKPMLRHEENIPAAQVGAIVDILTRTQLLATPEGSFPLYDTLCQCRGDMFLLSNSGKMVKENALLNEVTVLDRTAVIAVHSALHKLNRCHQRKQKPPVTLNRKTVNNILRMVDASVTWLQTVPSLSTGVKLASPGFNNLYPTRVDYVTQTGLWDMVVSEHPPHAAQLLKLMAYDILAFDSPAYENREFTEVGIINPRLGYRYWLPCSQFPVDAYDALQRLLKQGNPTAASA